MMLKFCPACDNMQYLHVEPAAADDPGSLPRLMYRCRHCGTDVAADDTDTRSCVLYTNYAEPQTAYRAFATPYIAHDPTLPRVSYIECANRACTRPGGAAPEVIYVKYDVANLKFLYHCVHCGAFWRSGGGAVQPRAAPREE